MLATAEFESPIGTLRLAATEHGVVQISLPRSSGAGFRGSLSRRVPDAELIEWLPPLDKLRQQLSEYFEGKRKTFDVPLDLRGTAFQLAVWRALSEIPFGETRSYGDIARVIGRPKAFRAVGAANGANPIPLVVPCHRVVASDGTIGGYGGGLEVKKRLLAFEKSVPSAKTLL